MAAPKPALPAWIAWLAPLGPLAAVVIGFRIVRGQPLGILGTVLGVLFLIPVVWVLISALWPARAERTCPSCGADALVRLDPESTVGLECRACGWSDETASAWLLAEEEGTLEDVVLRQRGRKPRAAVDSSPAPD